jgi:tetratricopeptide (TPR) repeat protein
MRLGTKILGFAAAVTLSLPLVNAAAQAQETKPADSTEPVAALPLTTTSPEARRMVLDGMNLYLDQVKQDQTIEILRQAVKLDPNFAMAHEFLAWVSLNGAEQVSEQQKAFATRKNASQPEQLLIEWSQDTADHKVLPAITKMNDLVGQYPHDKWVVWITTWWLMMETQYDRAIAIYEQSGIKDSPGLLNNMAYNYAYLRQYDKSFSLMEQYIAALPNDPNPQDSFAEILRLAGHFQQSIDHYRAALALDPNFYSSQFGMADTYSLMGDQVRARQEYAAGFKRFQIPELQEILWRTREAATYVREGDYKGADAAFQAIASQAHEKHLSQVEADTYRQMAIYQQDSKQALSLLNRADAALQGGENSHQTAIFQEFAQLQRARVEVGIKINDKQMVEAALGRLTELAQKSDDKLINDAFNGAEGAALYSRHQYTEAVSYLEQDTDNPLSLKLLIAAYAKVGDDMDVNRNAARLNSLNDPTVEQAFIVPAFRKCSKDPACSGTLTVGAKQRTKPHRPLPQ